MLCACVCLSVNACVHMCVCSVFVCVSMALVQPSGSHQLHHGLRVTLCDLGQASYALCASVYSAENRDHNSNFLRGPGEGSTAMCVRGSE